MVKGSVNKGRNDHADTEDNGGKDKLAANGVAGLIGLLVSHFEFRFRVILIGIKTEEFHVDNSDRVFINVKKLGVLFLNDGG